MIALQITSLKNLMNQMLTGTTFDIFLLEEAIITTSITYTIDGHINAEFYSDINDTNEFSSYSFKPWNEIKALCFDLIKGKHTPLNFKFILQLKPEHAEKLIKRELPTADTSQLKALLLLVKYDGASATVTTGTSYHTFVMDREPEKIWDRTIAKYLSDKEISYEEM